MTRLKVSKSTNRSIANVLRGTTIRPPQKVKDLLPGKLSHSQNKFSIGFVFVFKHAFHSLCVSPSLLPQPSVHDQTKRRWAQRGADVMIVCEADRSETLSLAKRTWGALCSFCGWVPSKNNAAWGWKQSDDLREEKRMHRCSSNCEVSAKHPPCPNCSHCSHYLHYCGGFVCTCLFCICQQRTGSRMAGSSWPHFHQTPGLKQKNIVSKLRGCCQLGSLFGQRES